MESNSPHASYIWQKCSFSAFSHYLVLIQSRDRLSFLLIIREIKWGQRIIRLIEYNWITSRSTKPAVQGPCLPINWLCTQLHPRNYERKCTKPSRIWWAGGAIRPLNGNNTDEPALGSTAWSWPLPVGLKCYAIPADGSTDRLPSHPLIWKNIKTQTINKIGELIYCIVLQMDIIVPPFQNSRAWPDLATQSEILNAEKGTVKAAVRNNEALKGGLDIKP